VRQCPRSERPFLEIDRLDDEVSAPEQVVLSDILALTADILEEEDVDSIRIQALCLSTFGQYAFLIADVVRISPFQPETEAFLSDDRYNILRSCPSSGTTVRTKIELDVKVALS